MPTSSKKTKKSPAKNAVKQSWLRQTISIQKERMTNFMARRPHRSFRLTRRRDYVRPLALPGNISFTNEVTRTLWKYKKIFLILAAIYAILYGLLVGIQSQESYSSISDSLQEAGNEVYDGNWSAVGQAALLTLSVAATGLNAESTEAQQLFSVLVFLMVWLTTVWLLRNLLAGHKVKVRDGLYNSASPLFAMVIIALIIAVQLIPVAIAFVGYNAALGTGLIASGGAGAMLFWIGAGLLSLLSLFWITSSLFAMIIVTIPGMYPLKAMRTAGDMVLGRRIKILLRWVWMALVLAVAWAVVIIPIILLDMLIKSLWPVIAWVPIVPVAGLLMAAVSTVWVSAYVYLLYRKVVDYVPES